MPTQLTRYALT